MSSDFDRKIRNNLRNFLKRKPFTAQQEDELVDLISQEIKQAVEAEREKAIKETLQRVLRLVKHAYNPVGGVSNMKYIFTHDIESLLQEAGEEK